MLESNQMRTGCQYTTTAALLIVSFVFVPALLFMSRPFGLASAWLALVCSVFCITVAGGIGTRCSQWPVPTMVTASQRATGV